MKHKHAELIKAWADGAKIQYKDNRGEWRPFEIRPIWFEGDEYRIKPEPKPDDVVTYCFVPFSRPYEAFVYTTGAQKEDSDNLKLIWDGTTGELKSAEVLK